jgi:hypothetical protein
MERFSAVLLLLLTVSVASQLSAQSVVYVNAATGNNTTGNGSAASPFKTITKALSVSSAAGDSIKVAPGTYNTAIGEIFPIEMPTDRKLIGTAGANTTIIDASGSKQRVFNCVGHSSATIIQGFTITGGFAMDSTSAGVTGKGGGLYISGGSQTVIQQNIITRDTARGYDFYQAGAGALNGGNCYGGGIYIVSSAPVIRNNVISHNFAYGGGGQDFRGGWSGNGAAGGNADGGGIHAAFGGASVIVNNTFYGNRATGGLGGSSNSLNAGNGGNAAAGALNAGASAFVSNNIFCNNAALGGTVGGGANGANGTSTDGAMTGYTAANYTNNLFFNNSAASNPDGATLGTNTVLADPLFVSTTNFHLQSLSPARKAGTATGAPSVDLDGMARSNPPSIGAYEGVGPTAVFRSAGSVPDEFLLEQNFPNPFNPSTTISYWIPVHSHVSLTVVDMLGREMETLVDGMQEPGKYSFSFDGSNLSSGVYMAKLRSGERMQLMKMLLMK